METLRYQVRPTLFSDLQCYALDPDGLEYSEQPSREATRKQAAPKAPVRVPLSAIRQIRLSYNPGRYDSNRFECQIQSDAPGPLGRCTLVSLHFRGLADFVDQGDRYGPFVRALCQRVAAQNPAVRILGGHSPLAYYAGLFFFGLVLVGGAALLFTHFEQVMRSTRAVLRLALVGMLLGVMLLALRRNRPRALSATALPDELLPKPADPATPPAAAP